MHMVYVEILPNNENWRSYDIVMRNFYPAECLNLTYGNSMKCKKTKKKNLKNLEIKQTEGEQKREIKKSRRNYGSHQKKKIQVL